LPKIDYLSKRNHEKRTLRFTQQKNSAEVKGRSVWSGEHSTPPVKREQKLLEKDYLEKGTPFCQKGHSCSGGEKRESVALKERGLLVVDRFSISIREKRTEEKNRGD